MKIIYMHHAERDIGPLHSDPIRRQEEGITETGIKECEILGEQFKKLKIKAIYTSPYIRCKHTAEIINNYLNVPIIEDDRLNECTGRDEIDSGDLWKRTMESIDDVINKYNNEDEILMITSGINITGFICYFYNIDPTTHPTVSQGTCCSPINFYINK